MRRWDKLNARQLELLRMIAAGQGDLKDVWSEVALSAQALQSRGLVKLTRSAGARLAEVTDAGRFYLEHGHHPDKPSPGDVPSRMTSTGSKRANGHESDPPDDRVDSVQSSEIDAAVAEPFNGLETGGGTLRITEPDPEARAWWRRVIHAAKAAGRVPAGHYLQHRGRDRGDLVIKLVKGQHPEIRYWQRDKEASRVAVAVESSSEIYPLAREFVGALRGAMSADASTRAEQLVSILVRTAEQRGHVVRLDGDPVSALTIDVDGCAFGLRMSEELEPVERVLLPSEANAPKMYDWQRVKPELVNEPTGRLVLELASDGRAYRGRKRRWGDTKRWRLDDKLGEILGEVEARAELLKERRRREEYEKARRQQQWEEAMQLATSRYYDALRVEALRTQVDAWEESCRVRGFCDYLDQLAHTESDPEREAEIRAWAEWARAYADRKDPGTQPRLLPEDKEPDPDDLRPYLGGWSPYGPEAPSYRRSW